MEGGVHAVFWSKGTVGRASFMAAFLVKRSNVIQASCFGKHPSLGHGQVCTIPLAVRSVDMALLLSRVHTQDFSCSLKGNQGWNSECDVSSEC